MEGGGSVGGWELECWGSWVREEFGPAGIVMLLSRYVGCGDCDVSRSVVDGLLRIYEVVTT